MPRYVQNLRLQIMRKFTVVKSHISEFPNPIHFCKGDILSVGDEYIGDEGWENWLECRFNNLQGFVPKQIIQLIDSKSAIAIEDYTALELNVVTGETLTSTREINQWIWAKNSKNQEGWVPLCHLQEEL